MTTLVDAIDAIYSRFTANWGSRTIFTFESEVFDEPDTADWVRLSVKEMPGARRTRAPKPNRIFTRSGIIFIQIFTKKYEGVLIARQHGVFARNIFEGETFGGVDCLEGTIRSLPDEETKKVTLVEIDFLYRETK